MTAGVKMVRILLLTVSLMGCALLSGCASVLTGYHLQLEEERKDYEKKEDSKTQYVTIDGFYVSSDTSDLVALSGDKAYRFEIEEEFIQILLLSSEISFTPKFDDFSINRDGEITGEITLIHREHLENDVTDMDWSVFDQLVLLGFIEQPDGELTYASYLKGRVYRIDGEMPRQPLRQEIVIAVSQPEVNTDGVSVGTVAKGAVLMPLAMTLDAALLPVYFVFIVLGPK
ncbi:hypothetical protein [Ostreibacterium oceani]|uniref:Lipoprotein n=1 Tax=Ostreibacterium oceani TaxID=2654998 RepID=A0A6N7EYZ6_9GAMM|nr:hypothetical protein [Ostreibacterium oceani]MPV85708.1 hypothetical protein [Ostreibacterium oceani]